MSFLDDLFGAPTPPTTPSAQSGKTTLTPTTIPIKTQAPATATPKLPRYLDGDFLQSIWNTESNGRFPTDAIKRNQLIGDNGKAKGLYQQHEDYVNTANMINDRKRREKAQEWANVNAPGWKNLKGPDGIKYQKHLASLPPAEHFTANDRTDFEKQHKIYMVMMPWAVDNFKKRFGREPNESELAMLHNIGGDIKQFGNKGNLDYSVAFEKHRITPRK
jgi:hypothetical protein